MEIAAEIDQISEHHVTRTKKDAYISNKLQRQNHSSTFFLKKRSLHSAASFQER